MRDNKSNLKISRKMMAAQIHVFVVVLLLIQAERVQSGNNVGLFFKNINSHMKNDTCGDGSGCNYFMKICFSLSDNKCSLGNFTTLSWKIKSGGSKTFKYLEIILTTSNTPNPYIKTLDKWRKQVVKLNASIWKHSGNASVFIEQHYFQTKLPFPTNSFPIKNTSTTKLTNCEHSFCLTMSFYMWCDVLSSCIDLRIENSSSIRPSTEVISTSSSFFMSGSTEMLIATRKTSNRETSNRETSAEDASGFTSTKRSIVLRTSMPTPKPNETSTAMRKHMFKTSLTINLNTNKPSNVQITISPSFSQSIPNKQSKTSKVLVGSWWFLLSVVVGGLLAILGIIVVIVKRKKYKTRVRNIIVATNMEPVKK